MVARQSHRFRQAFDSVPCSTIIHAPTAILSIFHAFDQTHCKFP
jgi:hypothetical protein